MKKLITILTLLLISQVLFAQAPQTTSYQAVIRNSSGNLLSSQLVKVRFSIHDSSANGTVVYQETQTPTTNAQGLVNLFAGKGMATLGTFAGINWGSKSKFLQTEIDIAGGSNYTDMGTTQLMSVPYALYSNNGNPNGTAVGEMLYWNGTTWVKLNPGANGQNLTFCNGVPQWGPCLILPTILTGSITAKTAITATAGGNVTDSGSAKITARGVCFSTTINPTIANTKTASGTNVIGAFTVSLTGLSALTTYHYRAYATTNVGTSYGADSVFTTNAATIPALTTTAASAITGTTATSGGNITSDNSATITARGICWSTTANPTIALNTKTVDGTGTGVFTSSITGLTANTLYYVRAYATNSAGTAYGTQVSFTTLRLPAVTTGAITNITNSIATASGNVTDSGSRAITARGVCYANTPNPLITNSFVATNGTNTVGPFTVSLTGLLANTRYYIRAFVTTSVSTSYGVDSVFTTNAATIPTLTTTAASAITGTTATSGGNITSDNGGTITARGICWSTSANPTVSLNTKTVNGTGTGVFSSNIIGLTANTIYYVRAYATNGVGTYYGAQVSFTTTNTSFVNLPSVTIGTQIWSIMNLAESTYLNGDPIPEVTDPTEWSNLISGAWCWFNNDSATYSSYGRLYNWYAVNDSRGLAPQGWHIPTNAEWRKITKYLDFSADTTQCCSNSAGYVMKSRSGWYNNGNGVNSSGFSGYPTVGRGAGGGFGSVGYYARWWSKNEYNSTTAWSIGLAYNGNSLNIQNSYSRYLGFSIRVVRD